MEEEAFKRFRLIKYDASKKVWKNIDTANLLKTYDEIKEQNRGLNR